MENFIMKKEGMKNHQSGSEVYNILNRVGLVQELNLDNVLEHVNKPFDLFLQLKRPFLLQF